MTFWHTHKGSWVGVLFLSLILLISAFSFSHAQTTLEAGIPGQVTAGDPVTGPVQYIKFLYLFVLSFVGVAGFVTLVIWGTVWVASSIIDQKTRALEGIKNALIGIALAFSAYLILAAINPDLTVIRLPQAGDVNFDTPDTPQASLTCCVYVQGGQYEGSPQSTTYGWTCAPRGLEEAACGTRGGAQGVASRNENCEREIGYSGLQCNNAVATTRLTCCVGFLRSSAEWRCVPRTSSSPCGTTGLSQASANICSRTPNPPPQCQ